MKMAQEFFEMQRERYRVLLRKRGVLPCPDGVARSTIGGATRWTTDPVLAQWRFCNVFREDDKTTTWFREQVREPLRDDPKVLLATVAFRWFNRIETGEKIKDVLLSGKWDSNEVKKRLFLQQPVVTGAFMVKTPSGMDKLAGVCWCVDQFARDAEHLAEAWKQPGGAGDPGDLTLQVTWENLREFPYMGGFMAYEVVSDLRHTMFLDRAPDIMTWANAGPGCTRGLGRVVHGDPGRWNNNSDKDQEVMLLHMRQLLDMSMDDDNWPSEWPRWEMREVEHGLCEFDKYCRGQAGEKLKRKYP